MGRLTLSRLHKKTREAARVTNGAIGVAGARVEDRVYVLGGGAPEGTFDANELVQLTLREERLGGRLLLSYRGKVLTPEGVTSSSLLTRLL